MPDLIRAWARRRVPALALAIVATLSAAATTHTAAAQRTLFSFRAPLGAAPVVLVQASDGHWYGATRDGGDYGHGALFVLNKRGTPRVIYAFHADADGGSPSALVAGGDGALYGLCELPGGIGLFRASTSGALSLLHTFATPSTSPLLAAGGGHVYASDGAGAIVEVGRNGQLRSIATGHTPALLALGKDGALYGASTSDGEAPAELFRLRPSDGQYTTLTTFAAVSDTSPAEAPTALTQDANANAKLYVATRIGQSAALYCFDAERGLQTLTALDTPATQLVTGRQSELYALTASELLRVAADGGTTTLHEFGASGSAPGSLALGSDGLYGTALAGGAGFGTLYRYAANGGYTTLYEFSYPDGTAPSALIRGSDGTLYGTTARGGAHGFGTVFKASSSGELETLHAFSGDDGSTPQSLTLGKDGVIYGRTREGGSGGQGTVFALSPNAALETWVSFDQPGQGDGPALVQTSDGTLFGADHADSGHVFRVRADHSYEAVYAFPGLSERDGATPSSLVVGADDVIYGATQGAYGPMIPTSFSSGTLFRIDAAGSFSTLYAFNEGDRALGAQPSSLVLGADGALYGASTNLSFLCGTYGGLFKLDPSTNATSLVYAFTGKDDGTGPRALVEGSSGVLYGLTLGGMGLVGADSENPGVCQLRDSTVFSYASGTLSTLATLPYALSQTDQGDTSHVAALVLGADGTLYGVAANGGSAGGGELFAVTAP